MKILVLGDGFIGREIQKYLHCNICSLHIKDHTNVKMILDTYTPDVVINSIGKVGKENVDWCEDNEEETLFSNVAVPIMIDRECASRKIKMVHIGSGCIYDGGEFEETDEPNFSGSLYSRSKIQCEKALSEDVLQLRIRMPICGYEHRRNLLTKLLKYKRIIDIKNSVTVIPDFLNALSQLMAIKAKGIFNVVNPVPLKHSEIINIYNEYADKKKVFNPMTLKDLEETTVAKRSNCRLNTDKLRSLGIIMEDSDVAIRRCVQEYVGGLCKI